MLIRAGSTPVTRTRKRLRIGYNSESFSVKSAYVGINPLLWMKFAIRRADTTNDAIYRKRYAHAMKSALRQVKDGGFDFI